GFLLTQYADSTFVATSGLSILRGRTLASDTAAREVLITEALARRLWPGQEAIGRRFRMDNEAPLRTVVGIIGVQRTPEGWVPADSQQVILTGSLSNEPSLVVRVDGSTQDAVRAIARVMQEEAPDLQVFDLRPLAQSVAEARAPQHFTRWLITGFAVLALALAAIGLYGVMAFGVVQRYREIGVRMALGARRSTIARLILGEGLRLCVAALVAGALGSLALTQLLQGMLVNVSRWDPWAYAGAALAMLAVAAVALWLPTHRATQVDPATAVAAD
ncbi:MAG: FtsX-like permease family protein, partial [Gemmatimonadetes bacterium]|nr:FtsX-like permease family protein [Gemmatimonadota bacterium]